MGIRVRKLARELRQTPRDVLQLLKSLGFERYQSPEDMISDTVAARVRSGAAKPSTKGHRAPDPALALPRPRPATAAPPSNGDLMAQLVPGVKRSRPDQRTSGNVAAAEEAALQKKRADLVRAEAALRAEREALEARSRELDAREATLATETTRLEAMSNAMDAREVELSRAREAFESARATFVAEQQLRVQAASKSNVVAVLRERGLRGLDEAQRALGALANAHALGPIVKDLAVADEEALRKLLDDRLVLVGGDIPEGLALPAISVSPDRADLPGAETLAKAAGKLSEQLLLCGFRAVTIAGMPPRWHGLVRALVDRRVALTFVPPPSEGPNPPGPSEAWLAWGAPQAEDATRTYWIPADGSLLLWLQRATTALAANP